MGREGSGRIWRFRTESNLGVVSALTAGAGWDWTVEIGFAWSWAFSQQVGGEGAGPAAEGGGSAGFAEHSISALLERSERTRTNWSVRRWSALSISPS
jgi:hypothetical protein